MKYCPSAEYRAWSAFRAAWGFFLVAAAIGLWLRLEQVYPLGGGWYRNLVHTHSHLAFLGWVFNAFFALAWLYGIPARMQRHFTGLFLVLQIACLGMLATFPVQGYGGWSIAFATLHSAGSICFAVWLWPAGGWPPAARWCLRLALASMLASGLGPLLLGPLAAMDLRESVWYDLSVYWYLHFQTNGWFILFPLALMLRAALPAGSGRLAVASWGGGVALTFLHSVLWLNPPLAMYGLAAAGAGLQITGAVGLFRTLRPSFNRWWPLLPLPVRLLYSLSGTALSLKLLAQLTASSPALTSYIGTHFTAIGFMHWVFLLVLTPGLLAFALQKRWIVWHSMSGGGIAAFLIGVLLSKWILLASPTGWGWLTAPGEWVRPLLLAGAALQVLGLALISYGLRGRPDPASATEKAARLDQGQGADARISLS